MSRLSDWPQFTAPWRCVSLRNIASIASIAEDLARQEARVPNLRDGCEKRIIWSGEAGQQTRCSVVFIHGFSATGAEIRPLPDLIAQDLGANIFFTRLAGHGQDGAAMGLATFADWMADVDEAFSVGATLGEEVILIGCSTGCTLASIALAQGAQAKAMIHVSPNFGLANRAVQTLLDLPGARHWAQYVAGKSRSFPAQSAEQEAFWTLTYPTAAVHVMADAVRAARAADFGAIKTPALFCFNEADQVVSARETHRAMKRWGAATSQILLTQTPGDDDMGHIMAGDIFSPGQTAPLTKRILAWIATL